MSRRHYPQPGTTCYACSAAATRHVWIEWSYMRGDDEREFVCARHADMVRSDFRRFMADAGNHHRARGNP